MTTKTTPDTRERIIAAARELLAEHGVAGVTSRAVGDRVGVSAMAMYRHFADRDALLGTLAEEAIGDLADRFATPRSLDVEETLYAMLDDLLDLAMAEPYLYALAFTDPRPGARELTSEAGDSPSLAVVIRTLQRGEAEGLYELDDAAEVALTVAALVQGLWLARHAGRIGLPDKEFRALVHRAAGRLLDGIRR